MTPFEALWASASRSPPGIKWWISGLKPAENFFLIHSYSFSSKSCARHTHKTWVERLDVFKLLLLNHIKMDFMTTFEKTISRGFSHAGWTNNFSILSVCVEEEDEEKEMEIEMWCQRKLKTDVKSFRIFRVTQYTSHGAAFIVNRFLNGDEFGVFAFLSRSFSAKYFHQLTPQ